MADKQESSSSQQQQQQPQQQQASGAASQPAQGQAHSIQQLKSKLSDKLQSHKVLVLKAHSFLSWEQDYYPAIIFALTSVAFLVIRLLNASILTTACYVGIIAALVDIALPTITKNLTKHQAKQNVDSAKFDKICLDLARLCVLSRSSCDSCRALKTKKPKLYYPILLISLIILAFIGSKFNNLFLTYLVTLFAALYPGLDQRRIPQKLVDALFQKLGKRAPQVTFTSFPPPSTSSSHDQRRSRN